MLVGEMGGGGDWFFCLQRRRSRRRLSGSKETGTALGRVRSARNGGGWIALGGLSFRKGVLQDLYESFVALRTLSGVGELNDPVAKVAEGFRHRGCGMGLEASRRG